MSFLTQFDNISCSCDYLTIVVVYLAIMPLSQYIAQCDFISYLKMNLTITFFFFFCSEAETGFHKKPLKSYQLIRFFLAGQQGEQVSESTLYKHSSGTRK